MNILKFFYLLRQVVYFYLLLLSSYMIKQERKIAWHTKEGWIGNNKNMYYALVLMVVLDEKVDQGSIHHADIYFWVIYIGIKRLKQATHNTLKETWNYKVGFDPCCWLTRGLELQLCYKRPIHVLREWHFGTEKKTFFGGQGKSRFRDGRLSKKNVLETVQHEEAKRWKDEFFRV